MPQHTPAERLKNVERARRTRSERELARLEAEEQGTAPPPAVEKKKKPAEVRGVGTPSFNIEAAIAKLRIKMANLSDPVQKQKLAARIQALKENAGL